MVPHRRSPHCHQWVESAPARLHRRTRRRPDGNRDEGTALNQAYQNRPRFDYAIGIAHHCNRCARLTGVFVCFWVCRQITKLDIGKAEGFAFHRDVVASPITRRSKTKGGGKRNSLVETVINIKNVLIDAVLTIRNHTHTTNWRACFVEGSTGLPTIPMVIAGGHRDLARRTPM